MSCQVSVLLRAEEDVRSARDWNERRLPGLSQAFLDSFGASMRALEIDPERTAFYHRDFRRVIMKRFPYKVFYQVIGREVIVFRVLHAKQSHETKIR